MVPHLGSSSPNLCSIAFHFLDCPIKRFQPSQLSPWKSDCTVTVYQLDQLIRASGLMKPTAHMSFPSFPMHFNEGLERPSASKVTSGQVLTVPSASEAFFLH